MNKNITGINKTYQKKRIRSLSKSSFLPLFGLILTLLFSSCTSCGSENNDKKTETITGKIFVTGNEPHTFTAIRTQNGETLEIIGNQAKKIRRTMQGKTLTVTGTIEESPSDPLLRAIRVKKISR